MHPTRLSKQAILLSALLLAASVLNAQTPLYISPAGNVGINLPNNQPLARLHLKGKFLCDTLAVTGPAQFDGSVGVAGSLGVTGTLASATLTVTGQAGVMGDIAVGGNIWTAGRSVYLGNDPNNPKYFIRDGRGLFTDIGGDHGVIMGYTADGKFNQVLRINHGRVGIGERAQFPRCSFDLVNHCANGELSAVLARLFEGDHLGDGTYLGVRAYSTQPLYGKSFSLEHRFYNNENGAINFYRGGTGNDGKITISFKGADKFNYTASGRLGIGTANPLALLDIAGNPDADSLYPAGGSTGWNLALRASGALVSGGGYYTTSDARHKKDIAPSDPARDLALLRKLPVSDFRYTDAVSHGSGRHKGFIAQDVEAVYPQAVQKSVEFIPDIYATPLKSVLTEGRLELTMATPHGLKDGDRVRLLQGGTGVEALVEIRNEYSFSVSGWTGKGEGIFVYGKQVSDFRSVDHQQIFSLGISALKELADEVDGLKQELARLRAELERKGKTQETTAAAW